MQPHIDQQIPLEIRDGSQKKHFIIQFINGSLRQTVGFIFETGWILVQHIYYFLHGYQSSQRRNQTILDDGSVQNFYFSALISPGPPVSCVFCSPALFFLHPRSFLNNNSKHDSGFWERQRLHCVWHRLYVNVYILSSGEHGWAHLSSSSGRLKNVRRGQQNSMVDPR